MQTKDPIRLPNKERMDRFINHVFGGWHHVNVKERRDTYVRIVISGSLSTHDYDVLTRLVVASHTYGVRAEICPCNMQYVTVWLHLRRTRIGRLMDRHPDSAELAERATKHWDKIVSSLSEEVVDANT